MTDVLPDIPRAVTGLAEWLACVVYLLALPRRFGPFGTAALFAAGFVTLTVIQLLAGALPLQFWMPGMALAALGMGAFIAGVAKLGPRDVAYVTARAFVLAELVASLEWQLHSYYFHPTPGVASPPAVATLVVAYCIVFGGAYLLERRHFDGAPPAIGWRTLSIAFAMVAITFLLSNLSFLTPNTPFSGTVSMQVFYIRTLVDLAGYIALYAQHEQLRTQRADLELAAMDAMLRTQHDQYLAAKRDIEQVSRASHDLKHQLTVIRAELDPARRDSHLDALEESLNQFGAAFDTGNPVLDAILTSKARYCQTRGINFTCVADGRSLGFVETMDLANIAGNALDNAIESVMRLPDKEQWLIRVAIHDQGGFVVLRFENYFDGELRYADGQIATRKAGDGHGLGLKSIRNAAEKYGGKATVTHEGNWFGLTVLMPVS